MINIRNNVFETNSSSSHSISISTDTTGILDTIECDDNGVITITGLGFGREWKAYNDPITKASYCLSDCQNDNSKKEMLRQVILEHTGASEVKFIIDSNSYIDNESAGLSHEGFVDKDTLKNLIFNPESYIFIGSDETTPPPNFYDVGKDIVFTHRLEIDGTDLVFKFCGVPNSEALNDAIASIMERHKENKWLLYDYDNDENETSCWEFIPWERRCVQGTFSSFTKRDQGVIVLYKTQSSYDADGNYLGESILSSKELYFRIMEI